MKTIIKVNGKKVSKKAAVEKFGKERVESRIEVGHYNENGEYVAGYEEGWSFYEEVAIHDYETEISGLSIGEYDSIQRLNELAEELENEDLEIVEAIIEATGCELEEAIGRDDVVFYKGQSMEDLAREIIEYSYNIPEELLDYIDYERYADSYFAYSEYHEVDGGVIYIG